MMFGIRKIDPTTPALKLNRIERTALEFEH